MHEQVRKTKQNKSKAAANTLTQKKNHDKQGLEFVDKRPTAAMQNNVQLQTDDRAQTVAQRQQNKYGLRETDKTESIEGGVAQKVSVGNAAKHAEEEYAIVGNGETITYTALAAGCLAVTVKFQGGGGAGVHLAMMEQGAGQWTTFLAAIAGNQITEAHLDCDGWGGDEGWRVNNASNSPQSTLGLILGGVAQDKGGLAGLGWSADLGDIKDWFETRLSVRPAHHVNQNPTYTMA